MSITPPSKMMTPLLRTVSPEPPTAAFDMLALSTLEVERLLHVIHASLEVQRRNQFFLWAQGQLQSFVPHEVMICAYGDFARRSLHVEHFSSYPLPGQDVDGILDVEGGLTMEAVKVWRERGERPVLVCGTDRSTSLYRRLEATLFRYAFPNLAVHGMPSIPGSPTSCFIFANLPQPLAPRQGYIFELIVPYIHCAFMRMLANERGEAAGPSVAERLITVREVEILQWVRDGKSNQEIGHILGISPLTVKNHVQKILKKLRAQNRAQAVARAISLQIIKHGTS